MTHDWFNRLLIIGVCTVLAAGTGCGRSRRRSSLLLERPAYGRIENMPSVARPGVWQLDPGLQTKTERGIEVTVRHADPQFLTEFFSNAAVFQNYAGMSPYYPEQLVFYVKLANHSERRIAVNPAAFVLVDDQGNQYHPIGVDYITAFEEFRRPVGSATRGLLEDANPGYFGVSVPVGRLFFKKPQARFALATQAALRPGPIFPGVVYDGLVPYWRPSTEAKSVRLILSSLKTDFDANDIPRTAVDIPFEFAISKP